MTCWPDDGGPFITLPSVITKRPGDRRAQRRHVPAAEALGRSARACTGRSTRTPPPTGARARPDGGRGRARHRSDHDLRGLGAAAEAHRRVRRGRASCAATGRARAVQDGRPRGAGQRRDRDRGLLPSAASSRRRGRSATTRATTRRPSRSRCCTSPRITHRRDPIYPSIVVGVAAVEDVWLGKATERIFLPAVQMTVPEIVDYDLPFAGAFHNCCIVSIRKRFPGHAKKVMHAIWGTGLLSLTKAVVVVDEWVDVHDYEQVVWQLGANVDPGRDVLVSQGPLDQLDHAPNLASLGGKIGFDATRHVARGGLPARVAGGRPHVGRRPRSGRRAVVGVRNRTGPTGCRCDAGVCRRAGAGSSAREVRDVAPAIAVRSRAGLCAVCSHVDTRPTADAECRCQLLWRRMSRVADPSGSHTGHDAAAGAAGAYVDPASARAAVSRGRFLTGVTLGLGGRSARP